MADQTKDNLDPKGPKQRNCSKQLQPHNVMVIVVGNGHGDTSSNPGRD